MLSTCELATWVSRLATLDTEVDDPERIAQLRALEALKSAAAAAQARVAVDFAASQRAEQAAAGVPRERVGAGVAEQIALARRESPTHGHRHLGLGQVLVHELPHTMAALTAGELSEWRATIVARATAVLSATDRRIVDARLASRLTSLSDRQLDTAARALAYELDPRIVMARSSKAAGERRVSIRPAPDTMAYLTALLPVAQGVAAYAALVKTADSARAQGDSRSRGQIAADTLVERVTGQATAAAVPMEIKLVLTDRSLLGDQPADPFVVDAADRASAASRTSASSGPSATELSVGNYAAPGSEERPEQQGVDAGYVALPTRRRTGVRRPDPAGTLISLARARERHAERPQDTSAHIEGFGPVPAALVRRILTDPEHQSAQVWIRRVFSGPVSGAVREVERERRLFPTGLRRLVVTRDQWCRTPWCGAPIRHADHASTWADGGATSSDNGQGLCESCNHAKQSPGWQARATVDDDGRHHVMTTTPTGATYESTAPPPLTSLGCA